MGRRNVPITANGPVGQLAQALRDLRESAGLTLRKASGTEAEKQALSATTLSSEGGKLSIHFATGDAQFNSLLQSPLFRGIVR